VGGRVLSDAGLPVPAAAILVEHKGPDTSAITDSSGAYRTAVAAGTAKVWLDASSLPPGYELRGSASHQVELVPQRPVEVDFIVRAQRALQARVSGAAGVPATVTVAETGQQAATDAAGQVMLRGLPAGKLTLVARGLFGERREEVVMPAEPGVVRGVVIGEPRR
jgi:outer membrane usher protein FimD/PapC